MFHAPESLVLRLGRYPTGILALLLSRRVFHFFGCWTVRVPLFIATTFNCVFLCFSCFNRIDTIYLAGTRIAFIPEPVGYDTSSRVGFSAQKLHLGTPAPARVVAQPFCSLAERKVGGRDVRYLLSFVFAGRERCIPSKIRL